jgi:DNA repair exonuclease SbcCD ATPase subunit
MIQKIKLENLILVGFKKNYEVQFHDGLNYISGPVSTGKTMTLELINYVLGSDKHKNYLELRENCSDVILEFYIGKNKYKISRPLFDFNRPVKLYRWNKKRNEYHNKFDLLEIDIPSNENSLSNFLLKELGFNDIKVANQSFSFRDIFKYCYIKQTQIDSENLLKEKTWASSLKRKPTLEIIFNIYDKLLADLKKNEKKQKTKINKLETKKQNIEEFLKSLNLIKFDSFKKREKYYQNLVDEKSEKLKLLKNNGKSNTEFSLGLETEILELKKEIENIKNNVYEQKEYVNKLLLLRNQYSSELEKIEFLLEGATLMNQIEFNICPSCLNQIGKRENDGCDLCGNNIQDLSIEELKVYKSKKRRLKRKFNNLSSFIEKQKENIKKFKDEKREKISKLNKLSSKLDHLRNEYISPYIAQIEQLNYEIGELKNKIYELQKNLAVIDELDRIKNKLEDEYEILSNIKKNIKDIEENTRDKQKTINKLSKKFNYILSKFEFPKLSNAYIDIDKYLPHVRGRKYDDIGSLGAVTMLTIAYFISILIVGISDNNNHPGLLIIDSPRKNLGANQNDEEEFKDEKIFNSIIRYLVELDNNFGEEVQLIVVNNGYPEFLSSKYIVKQFDGKGTKDLPYGLIDNMTNNES